MRNYEDRPQLVVVVDANETSEMLESIEAIVLSIADRVDRLSALMGSLMEGEIVRGNVRQVWNGERWVQQ